MYITVVTICCNPKGTISHTYPESDDKYPCVKLADKQHLIGSQLKQQLKPDYNL